MENCVFCKIINGTKPASIVYFDDKVLAFLDIQPVNPGHTLIVPKKHAAYLSELDEDTSGHMFKVVMRISKALRRSGIRCDGVNLYLADGEAAAQDVFHVHLHVIPRFIGDGHRLRFAPYYGTRPDRKELDETAAKIRNAIT